MEDESNRLARVSPLKIDPPEFRRLGYEVVDRIADLLESLPTRPVTRGESPLDVRKALEADRSMPDRGTDPGELLDHAANLLFDHSLFNGHPRFWGYITSSATPIGALGDLLAASVNPNVGAWPLSPMASEIEAQTIRWIAAMLDYPEDCGGLFVSGGNMANIVGFLAARRAESLMMFAQRDWMAHGCASTARKRRTHGSRRPPIFRGWARMRSDGLP